MGWFRSNLRLRTLLALFALTVQFSLTFGHTHGIRAAQAASFGQTTAGLNSPAAPGQPTGLIDDSCAICTLIQMAGTIVPTTGPVLVPPVFVSHERLDAAHHDALLATAHLFFRARAPPAV
jgi:hypothetical protein